MTIYIQIEHLAEDIRDWLSPIINMCVIVSKMNTIYMHLFVYTGRNYMHHENNKQKHTRKTIIVKWNRGRNE